MRSPSTSYDPVEDLGGRLRAEEGLGVRRAVVVVAHAPHDLRAGRGGRGLDHRAQLGVGLRLAAVGQVAGEHDRLRRRVDPAQPVERQLQVLDGVDHVVLQLPARQQVGVADVGDDVAGMRVLTERLHGRSVEGLRDPPLTDWEDEPRESPAGAQHRAPPGVGGLGGGAVGLRARRLPPQLARRRGPAGGRPVRDLRDRARAVHGAAAAGVRRHAGAGRGGPGPVRLAPADPRRAGR